MIPQDVSAGMAGFLGIALFLIGLSGSQHVGRDKAKARFFFWLTALGTAFFAVSTYGLQFHSPHRIAGADNLFYVAWSFTAMLTVMVGVNVLRLHRPPSTIAPPRVSDLV